MPRTEREYEELAAYAKQSLDRIDPNEFTPVAPQIVRLREAVAARQAVEEEIEAAVEAMRLSGFSWERIALVLGVSRQAAHVKYAEKVQH